VTRRHGRIAPRTPATGSRKIVHLRWKQRLGPVQIADQVGVAPSTVHKVLVCCRINRLSHVDRVTAEPIRRYEHDHPGSLIHVDVKKLGNVPDGGGWRYLGRQQGLQNRLATAHRTGNRNKNFGHPLVGTAFVHTVIDDPLPRRLRRDPPRRVPADRSPGATQRGRLVRRARRDRRACAVRHSIWVCGVEPVLSAGGGGSASSGTCPSSLLDRVERPATPGLLTVLAGGASAGGSRCPVENPATPPIQGWGSGNPLKP
jgi:hypothetical protein